MNITGTPLVDYKRLRRALFSAKRADELNESVVNAPFEQKPEMAFLFLGLISFFLVDEASQMVYLAAVSHTEQYNQSVRGYDFDETDYHLSLKSDQGNDIVKAILINKPQKTLDWGSLSRPAADRGQARLNQASGGIAYSMVYPLPGPARGALLYCYFQYEENIGPGQQQFMERYTKLVSDSLGHLG